MAWASRHIERLQTGETVSFRPRGNSMAGTVDDGDLVTVAPLGDAIPNRGDVVLCKVGGRQYLHLVKAVQGGRALIGNAKGRDNGWTSLSNIYGVMIGRDR